MELLAVGVWGIRRFADKTGPLMDVVGSPIAIVGPNAAGKTTFLKSLEQLNDAGEIPQRELTRGSDGAARITAHFRLGPSDLEAIADLPLARPPRTVEIYKREDGQHYLTVEPQLARDPEPRQKTLAAVQAFSKSRWALKVQAGTGDAAADEGLVPRAALSDIAALLSDTAPFDSEELERLGSAVDALEMAPDLPVMGQRLVTQLRKLHELERGGDRPRARAASSFSVDRVFFGSTRAGAHSNHSSASENPLLPRCGPSFV